jgi:quercetin dioxygenase-like cupin family protein
MQNPQILFHGGDKESGEAFIVETRAPAGWRFEQHKHDKPHLSYLVSGSAMLIVDGLSQVLKGPVMTTIEANKVHEVCALTPMVWLCIWADPGEEVKEQARYSVRLLCPA